MSDVLVVAIGFSASLMAGLAVIVLSTSRIKARDRLGGIIFTALAMMLIDWLVPGERSRSDNQLMIYIGLMSGFILAFVIAANDKVFRRLLIWKQ